MYNYKKHIYKWNKYYQQVKEQAPWEKNESDKHVIDFVKNFSFSKKSSILDVGCGYGKNSIYLINKGFDKYTGLDISYTAIKKAKKKHSKGTFILGNILTTNKIEKKFDIIIDAGCFHVNKKNIGIQILKKYKKLLKKRGKIFLRVFKANKKKETPLFFIDNYLPTRGYTEKEIKSIVQKNFKIDKFIFDKDYYKEDEIFYLYLSNK